MVQAKKFEQTFVNEYLAWKLHDKDVERRGRKAFGRSWYIHIGIIPSRTF